MSRQLAVLLFLLLAAGVLLPFVASAWSLNRADIDLAHASALPTDSPRRVSYLSEAASLLGVGPGPAGGRIVLAQARTSLDRGDVASALANFERLDEAVQQDPVAQFAWGQAALQAQQPESAYAHWRQGGAYEYFSQQMHRADDRHDWQAAADYARIAVGIDPSSADAHYILGDAWSRIAGWQNDALAEIGRAQSLTTDPEFLSTIISRRGEILGSQGRWSEALVAFEQARSVAPIDARPRTGFALALVELDPAYTAQAQALLEQVTQDSPWYTAAYVALARFSESANDLASAEKWLEDGLTHNPNNAELLFALGQFHARHGRIDQAKADLASALKFVVPADELRAISEALAALSQN